jgi:multimeric flavodoxin WrbA
VEKPALDLRALDGMNTVILSAACPELGSLSELESLVHAELRRTGEAQAQTFALATTKLAYCQGEFDCWVKTPGVCRAHDAEQDIVRAIHDADNVVLIDAITDGGHSYVMKRAQDRMICLLSPFFEKRASLTHHGSRYDRQASLFALGWMRTPDPEQARTWCDLADGNAINMLAPRIGVAVVDDTGRSAWPAEVCAMLASRAHPGTNITDRGPLRAALVEAARPAQAPPVAAAPPRTAAILVGSAKIKGTSVSENLARACALRLQAEGVTSELHFATDFVHDRKGAATADAIARADLFVLATPLYVDALPALVVHAFDQIARARAGATAGRFTMIVNCGFPEPEHTRTALRIARHFCARAAYHWAGGLPLGGGGAIQPGTPLDEQHGPAEHVRRALDAAMPALARGDDVPEDARAQMIRSPLPDIAYRVIGDLGWRYQAYRNGLHQSDLRGRPLD